MPPTATRLPGTRGCLRLSGRHDLAFDQFVVLTADLDPAWFHGLGYLAHQVDMQETVLQIGTVDPHIVGQLVGAFEVAVGDATMQVLAVGDVGIFSTDDLEQVFLGLDVDFLGTEACDSQGNPVLVLARRLDVVRRVTASVRAVGRFERTGQSVESDSGTKQGERSNAVMVLSSHKATKGIWRSV